MAGAIGVVKYNPNVRCLQVQGFAHGQLSLGHPATGVLRYKLWNLDAGRKVLISGAPKTAEPPGTTLGTSLGAPNWIEGLKHVSWCALRTNTAALNRWWPVKSHKQNGGGGGGIKVHLLQLRGETLSPKPHEVRKPRHPSKDSLNPRPKTLNPKP